MIISHKHKFIFIKTMKTAGTSIESFLAGYCADNDVVSFIAPPDEFIRRQQRVFPMNNLRPEYNIPDEKNLTFESIKELREFRVKHHYHPFAEGFEKKRTFYQPHQSATSVRTKVGTLCWDKYFTFCFECAPWERVLSAFYYTSGNHDISHANDQQIHDFVINRHQHKSLKCNSNLYTDAKDRVIIDKVYDFERLDEAMQELCERLGFDHARYQSLPKFKATIRKDQRSYEEFLSKETIDLITEAHKPAVQHMDYKPNPPKA